jgi:glycosyltransferase involved in cell wall biosynthesis
MKVLIVTTEWSRYDGDIAGIHVVHQIRQLEQAGIKVDVFPFQGRKNPFNYFQAIHEFKHLDLRQYDIIHAHHGQAGIVALSQQYRPVAVTFHGSDLQGIRDWHGRITLQGYLLRYSSRWAANRANAVILVSQHLARFLPKQIVYQVIPAGIDLDRFRPLSMSEARRIIDLPLETRLILFIGNPDRTEKRYWLAQKSVEILARGMDVRLVLANNVPNYQMPLYMNACDVLVVTSSTEGSPNIVKEALACDLPIVSTDVGDVRQRIGNVDGCLVCKDDNPNTIASALNQILDRPGRINGRNTVLDLDERCLARQVIAVYEKLLLNRPVSVPG